MNNAFEIQGEETEVLIPAGVRRIARKALCAD